MDGTTVEFVDDPGSDDAVDWLSGTDAMAFPDAKFAKKDAKTVDVVKDTFALDVQLPNDGGDATDNYNADVPLGTLDGKTVDIVGEFLSTPGNWWGVNDAISLAFGIETKAGVISGIAH